MFRDDRQRAQVCQTLMDLSFEKGLFTAEGPTERAVDLLEADGRGLSGGERVLFLVCWSLWNSDGDVPFGDLFRLDDQKLHAVGSLLVALARGGGLEAEPSFRGGATAPYPEGPAERETELVDAWLRVWGG